MTLPRTAYRKLPPKNCIHCGKEFSPRHSLHVACSLKCHVDHKPKRRKATPPFVSEVAVCPVCHKEFAKKRERHIYCSRYCIARGTIRLGSVHSCEKCGKEFMPRTDSLVRNGKRKYARFCSKRCAGLARWNKVDEGRKRKYKPTRATQWINIAKSIRERDKNTCRICRTKVSNRLGTAMNVDHIIPESVMGMSDLFVHSRWNLLTLCNSCHARKTAIECTLLQGKVEEFVQKLREIGYPMKMVSFAITCYSTAVEIRELLPNAAVQSVQNLESEG